MITRENYLESIKGVDFLKLNKDLQDSKAFFDEVTSNGSDYTIVDADDSVSEMVDLYFELLGIEIGKVKKPVAQKKTKVSKPKTKEKPNSDKFSQREAEKMFIDFLDHYVQPIKDIWVNEELDEAKELLTFKNDMIAIGKTQPFRNASSFNKFLDQTEELFAVLNKYVDEVEEPHRKSGWADYLGSYEYVLSQARKISPKKVKKSSPSQLKPKRKIPKSDNAKRVEKVSEELKFIRRYINMNNKAKKRSQIRLFISALQKSIREKRITKKSEFAKEIMLIQKALITMHKKFKDDDEQIVARISDARLSKFLPLIGKQVQMLSVRLIKSYITLQGKIITNKKAHNLHTRIVRAYNAGKITKRDTYWGELESIMEQLATFIEKNPNEGILRIESRALHGLSGIVNGCPCDEDSLDGFDTIPERTIMNSMDIVKLNFKKLDFKGKWREFIGNPSKGFSAMIFAKPKMGKSYMSVDWAGYLANNHGTVLYVAKEEGIDETLQKKLREKAVMHPDLYVSNYLPEDLSRYDFVFLDSITKLKLTPSDLALMEAGYPNISFISIFQVTKSGNFRGNNGFQHEVDVVIEIPEKGKAIQYGRFNQGGEMDVFDDMGD